MFKKCKANFWANYYRAKNLLFRLKLKLGCILALIAPLFLSWIYYFRLNKALKLYFILPEHASGLKTLLIALCVAMLGVSVITFSFIIFAMQTNMSRMPYGLFRKFSSDRKLLIYFVMIFIMSIVTGCLSMLPVKYLATFGVLGTFWAIIFIMLFLLAAYKRALKLINPVEQLVVLTKDTEKNLKIWGKAATRLAPFLTKMKEVSSGDEAQNNPSDTGYNLQRAAYFALNPQWTLHAKQAVQYAVSLARYHVEQNDYEISKMALDTIVKISSDYIFAKGRTFCFESPIFSTPNSLTHDSFIQDTLELLRQNLQIIISSGDEQRITQMLKTLKDLCMLYLHIDYSTKFPAKRHANLASSYLTDSVESVLPHKMIDVLMNGLRMLGEVALQFVNKSNTESVASLSGKISLFSSISVSDTKYFPVTQVGVQQLAKITYSLLISQMEDVSFALGEVNEDVKFIAKLLLQKPDNQDISFHRSSLNYYYPDTNTDSLIYWLRDLGNFISQAKSDDENAKRITRHIACWGDGIYQKEKELLLLAIENKSSFISNILYWIVHLTEFFLVVSKAKCCSNHFSDQIRKNALWLICALSCSPDEEDKLKFIEKYNFTNLLFQASIDANKHDCHDVARKISDSLLSWTFKAGKHESCQHILEKGCYGLACLNLRFKFNNSVLCASITSKLGEDCAPSRELLGKASKALKNKAEKLPGERDAFAFGEIEVAMSKTNPDKMHDILVDVAGVLDGATKT